LNSKYKSLLLTAVMATAAVLYADEAAERKLGDSAFFAEDYRTAISFYESALELSNSQRLADAWAENALRLGAARLFDGDIAGAKRILAEFRRRNPVRSAGTLPGDILAAEGKFAEAENFFSQLEKSGSDRIAAKFSKAALKLRAGKLKEAADMFREVRDESAAANPSWQYHAAREYIYTLIMLNKVRDALDELKNIPPDQQTGSWKYLHLAALLRNGQWKKFKETLPGFLDKELPRPHKRIAQMLMEASRFAVKEREYGEAVKLLLKAEDFASSEKERREILKSIFNLQSSTDIHAAVATAGRYALLFSAAADRGEILTAAARLLGKNGNFNDAAKLLITVMNDATLKLSDRTNAADDGAIYAERAGLAAETAAAYDFLCRNAAGAKNIIAARSRYAAYLKRQKNLTGAEKQLRSALRVASQPDTDRLRAELLLTINSGSNRNAIIREAKLLAVSKNPDYAAMGNYEIAVQMEKSGNFNVARQYYLRSTKGAKYRKAAQFNAALMAQELKNFTVAAEEFYAFVKNYPAEQNSSDALYMAMRNYRSAGDKAKERHCHEQLVRNYHGSTAYVSSVLQMAADMAAFSGDLRGAVAELRALEQTIGQNSEFISETVLMRANLHCKLEEYDEALAAISTLLDKKNLPDTAPEAAMLAGSVNFDRGDYSNAREYYLQAERYAAPQSLTALIAAARVVESEIALFGKNDRSRLAESAKRCRTLISKSNIAPLRLHLRYNLGICCELAGDTASAIKAYEELLYEALDMKKRGIEPEARWCVKATENVLQLLVEQRGGNALQRGMRVIDNMEKLQLEGTGFSYPRLRAEFRKKLSSK